MVKSIFFIIIIVVIVGFIATIMLDDLIKNIKNTSRKIRLKKIGQTTTATVVSIKDTGYLKAQIQVVLVLDVNYATKSTRVTTKAIISRVAIHDLEI
jgi:hypothetical protein